MNHAISLLFLAAALSTGACQLEKDTETPVDKTVGKTVGKQEQPAPAKLPVANISIASASLLEDCPDPVADPKPEMKGAASTEGRAAPAAPTLATRQPPSADMEQEMAEGDSDRYSVQPCSQSTMQISIRDQGESSFQFKIAAVRVLSTSGESLGTVQTRMPTVWNAEGYAAWDEMVAPMTAVQASYKLGMPVWDDAATSTPRSLYGMSFILEADVLMDGVSKTIRSNVVVPEPPDMVET